MKQQHHRHNQPKKGHIGHFSFWHIIRLYIVYTFFAYLIFALTDFLAFEVFNQIMFLVFALITGVIATGVHVWQGNKSWADELAEDL
jgi:uncharacterized membrane protein (DUF485 family)